MTSLLLGIIYLAFISLGLPDALLGSAWPLIYQETGVPMSWSGILFMTISVGTVLSSLMSDRLVRRFGAGGVTAVSVAMTACALFGFSISRSFWTLWLFAIPYGLGAGSVDAALNNFVALHFASRHMSWLHCMWGIGTTVGPTVMSTALTAGQGWHSGYRRIALLQVFLTLILCISLPLWKRQNGGPHTDSGGVRISFRQILILPGAGFAMLCFFCYCALEQTVNLWASSYLVACENLDPVRAAGFASLFFIGITAGRGLSGFITCCLNDRQRILL